MRILIASNSAWNIANFRAGLIQAMIHSGYQVDAAAPPDEHVTRVEKLGCRFHPLPIDNNGTNPFKDLLLTLRFIRLFFLLKSDVYLGYTIKPNIYGSLAAHILRIPVINNIAGLGTVFNKPNWLQMLVKKLYHLSITKSRKVFFQNKSNLTLFVQNGLVKSALTDRLPGSGVNLSEFSVVPLPEREAPFRFLLVARMLWEKGVGEFVEAARILKPKYPDVEFCLLGFLDVKNPSAISQSQMNAWVAEGVVCYLGATSDVRPYISDADCCVLPSFYPEGTPRSLLEAAAIGRPIITTNSAGCRDVVDDGVNGYLCKMQDVPDLVKKMEQMMQLPLCDRARMGHKGREKVEREFDEKIVIDKYLDVLKSLSHISGISACNVAE
ncbi:MAG: glycosyltransferase family 4 protein [Magnetococcales bacterium]|nr:glycosyltransferase family 4 protein [Magnetococcales bacterium]